MSNSAYCPIVHLAMSLCPSPSWTRLLMGMFTAYFDASGQEHEHPYMTVAGFVSSASTWSHFSETWKKTLSDYGLHTFHAADCQSYEGEFKPWRGQDDKRIRLWCDLLGVIKEHTFQKFGVGIEIDGWKSTFSKEKKAELKINAYTLCAMACAGRVKLWAKRQNIKSPIEYVYESGDPGSGSLKPLFESEEFPAPSFKHKQDRSKGEVFYPACIPLQAADFLAYEIFLTKKIFRKNGTPSISRPMREFRDMPEAVKLYSGKGLEDLAKNFKYPMKAHGIWRVS